MSTTYDFPAGIPYPGRGYLSFTTTASKVRLAVAAILFTIGLLTSALPASASAKPVPMHAVYRTSCDTHFNRRTHLYTEACRLTGWATGPARVFVDVTSDPRLYSETSIATPMRALITLTLWSNTGLRGFADAGYNVPMYCYTADNTASPGRKVTITATVTSTPTMINPRLHMQLDASPVTRTAGSPS